MKFQNLDQIRAKNAIKYANTEFKGADGGGVVKKIPVLIRDNGFLGALAFALENKSSGEKKNPGHYKVFECILDHLKIKKIESKTPEDLFKWLVEQDSAILRDITQESLLYLNYLRRFAKPGKDN